MIKFPNCALKVQKQYKRKSNLWKAVLGCEVISRSIVVMFIVYEAIKKTMEAFEKNARVRLAKYKCIYV